ncbi:unnamed protein product [Durusdinium trenchii]|uniref:Uncharacterized protein n=1 Tax=Durusdinium trenchii TaxID=1381693 RepID=A0ABP0L7N3_9DINO
MSADLTSVGKKHMPSTFRALEICWDESAGHGFCAMLSHGALQRRNADCGMPLESQGFGLVWGDETIETIGGSGVQVMYQGCCNSFVRERLAARATSDAVPVFLWLWWQMGPLALLILLGLWPTTAHSASSASAPVEAFVAYEAASRQRWDLIEARGAPDLARAQGLRAQALQSLQQIHTTSQRLALCLSRWPQLLALFILLASARWAALPPEVLVVVFLQCHYLQRQLSVLQHLRNQSFSAFEKLEALLRREEVLSIQEAPEPALLINLPLVLLAWREALELPRREVKWVLLRGLFGCSKNALSNCAVLAGAQVGSVGVHRLEHGVWVFA